MSRVITIPTSPGFITSEFSLYRAIGATVSPFTGKVRTQEFDAVYWQITAQLPLMNRTQAANWQSFLMQLKGPTNTFLLEILMQARQWVPITDLISQRQPR